MTDIAIQVAPPQPRVQPRPDGGLILFAPAKINLNLLVGPRREDGFHGLDSYVAKITLYDRIEVLSRQDGHIHLHSTGIHVGPVEENLALAAGRMLRQHCLTNVPAAAGGMECPGADIELHKQVPPGKGLGGGSSDAATVLEGLRALWRVGVDENDVSELAGELGSDVPLFLGPPASRMTGRGEILHQVNVHPFTAGLFLPEIFCPTPKVYQAFDDLYANNPPDNEQLDATVLAQPPSRWRERLVNHLLPAAERVAPELAELRGGLQKLLPCPVHMSGSGSALFILCDDANELSDMLAHLPEKYRPMCRTVQASPF